MAVSTVSSVDQEIWQLIATNSPTSGTTTTFSGLSGYKKYILAFAALNTTTNPSDYNMTFNSSSSDYSSRAQAGTSGVTTTDSIRLARGNQMNGFFTIENVNLEIPKIVTGVGAAGGSDAYQVLGSWNSTSAITSITITLGAGTYNSGSVRLYGVVI